MHTLPENILLEKKPWFQSWFDSRFYHLLYKYRDEVEAQAFINRLLQELQPPPGSLMLDVGCGKGRHSVYLASKGYTVTGFDLAPSSILEAKKNETQGLQFFRHDMRVPFAGKKFDYVFNFFTSFGYFKDEEENQKVIDNLSAALKPDGFVLIDYLNTAYAEEHLVPHEEKEIDGIVYSIHKWTDDDFLYKKIIVRENGSHVHEYIEHVAKFHLSQFEYFFQKADLKIENLYGDYNLKKYLPKKSRRLILLAKKGCA